ncbi:DUF2330 domain-containing protein [Streptomyces sp. NPDC056949]|uniref:DUF2330 domain-containing protein n=1 Tax=Streptomyces sp. NPDC056949 TaxID=3345976 RepID=UPI00363202EE
MRTAQPLTMRARALLTALALMAFQIAALASPAYACGCGAMVSPAGTDLTVYDETSAVRWDGRSEQIVMSLSVSGDVRDAAWIMPVPHRASVELGDPGLFSRLSEVTAPVERTRHHFWPGADDWPFDGGNGDGASAGAPAPGGPVQVVGREHLGPFDVARLTATDPDALADWLDENGFQLPGRLDTALRPYVDKGWEYVAIRLTPADGDSVLGGALDPLHLTFASDRLVYPMRLSKLARTEQHLRLYVLAAHRMEPRSAIGGDTPEVTYAGRIPAKPGGPLPEFAGGERYLTALTQDFPQPSRIYDDHELRRTASDATHRTVVWDDELLTAGGVPVWLLTVPLPLALLLTAAAVLRFRRHSRRPVPPPPPVHAPPPLG